jgi:hypothetical protein
MVSGLWALKKSHTFWNSVFGRNVVGPAVIISSAAPSARDSSCSALIWPSSTLCSLSTAHTLTLWFLELLPYGVRTITETARWYIPPREVARAIRCNGFSLGWQSTRRPIRFARGVAKDLGKPQADEPPRGSGAQVSLIIVAVNDDWLLPIKLSRALRIEMPQKDVDRSRQMLFFVFRFGEHLEQPPTLRDQLLHFVTIDRRYHWHFSLSIVELRQNFFLIEFKQLFNLMLRSSRQDLYDHFVASPGSRARGASCLSLLSNAVLVWNTMAITKIVTQLRAAGETIVDEDLARISPLIYQHVIPNGTYHFARPKLRDDIA